MDRFRDPVAPSFPWLKEKDHEKALDNPVDQKPE